MGQQNNKIDDCIQMILKFLQNANSVKGLDIIIDIYDEIRYSSTDEKDIKQRILKILHNLIDSHSLNSLLSKEDRQLVTSLLREFLKINCKSQSCCLGNKEFAQLNLDELYYVLIEAKYLKERELTNRNKLPVNG